MVRCKASNWSDGVLAHYPHGPDASVAATALALRAAPHARALIMVEGVSDQIALESLARRQGRDLAAEGVAVFVVGGSGSLKRHLVAFGKAAPRPVLAGLFDRDAVALVRRAVSEAGLGASADDIQLAKLGFHLCDRDLEDELIRAVGVAQVETIIKTQGEAVSLATLRKQAGWIGRPASDQLHRFLRSRARRSLRYAHLLVEAMDEDRIPAPLSAVLATV